MKVIQINCVYGRGSTGSLTMLLHQALLNRGDESLVFYGRGGKACESGVRRIGNELLGKINGARAKLTGCMYNGCELETALLLRQIQLEKPDIVHLHCINGHFVNIHRLVSFLKQHAIPTVLTLHAEFMYTANCSHAYDCDKWERGCGSCPALSEQTHSLIFDRTAKSWRQMENAFAGFDRLSVIAVSPWQEARARQSPFFTEKRIRTILNGIDTTVFHPTEEYRERALRHILYVTPRFDLKPGHNKGGEFLYPLANRLGEQFQIRAVGPGNWGNPPKNVELLGPVYDKTELAKLYTGSEVTLLTSKRETFSLVAAESLCCGTPVAGFYAGGPESIAIPRYARFCTHGDLDSLCDAIQNMPAFSRREIAQEAKTKYSKDRMIREYLEEYEKVRTLR